MDESRIRTEQYTGPSALRIANLLGHRVSFEKGWFWTTAFCHGGHSDGLAFRQRPDGNGIEVRCHTGGCGIGVVITEMEELVGLDIWTAYEPVSDAASKAPEKRPWWKRPKVIGAGVVALVVAAPLLTLDLEVFFLNLFGLGIGALLLWRFMPRRRARRLRRWRRGPRPLTTHSNRKGRLLRGAALLLCPQAGADRLGNTSRCTKEVRNDDGDTGSRQSDDGRGGEAPAQPGGAG